LFAYGPADATAIQKRHHLLPHLNPDWFYLSGTGLPRVSWKKSCKMGVVVAFIVKMPAEQPLTSVVAEYGSVTAEVAADSSDTNTVVGA